MADESIKDRLEKVPNLESAIIIAHLSPAQNRAIIGADVKNFWLAIVGQSSP